VYCFSNCAVIGKRQTPRHARKLPRGAGFGFDIGIGDGGGSVSDGEVASLAATQQEFLASSARLHHHLSHHRHHHQHHQPQHHHARLLDACPGPPRRVMQAIRESPEISSNPADAR